MTNDSVGIGAPILVHKQLMMTVFSPVTLGAPRCRVFCMRPALGGARSSHKDPDCLQETARFPSRPRACDVISWMSSKALHILVTEDGRSPGQSGHTGPRQLGGLLMAWVHHL